MKTGAQLLLVGIYCSMLIASGAFLLTGNARMAGVTLILCGISALIGSWTQMTRETKA